MHDAASTLTSLTIFTTLVSELINAGGSLIMIPVLVLPLTSMHSCEQVRVDTPKCSTAYT